MKDSVSKMSTLFALPPADMVIFGGMGDLSLRKILPALYYRFTEKQFNHEGRIFVLAKSELAQDAFLAQVHEHLQLHVKKDDFSDSKWRDFSTTLRHVRVDANDQATYASFSKLLSAQARPVRVFYLATPSSAFGEICHQLKVHGLITSESRVVVEKPLGSNMATFQSLDQSILDCFHENQIYRIDHYLGKETVQNLIVLRFANNIFERLWNSDNIEHVQITVAEEIGVGSRGRYYDDSGALRDMVQNHLLQLLCLVAMEAPSHITPDQVRDEKLKVLKSLRPILANDCQQLTVKGQYRSGMTGHTRMNSYVEDVGVVQSQTETYVALKAFVDNWRWSGVPFYLRTGKRMQKRFSEIVIQFRAVPLNIFPDTTNPPETNKLIIRLQPDESVKLQVATKTPGPGGYRIQPVFLNLSFSEAFTHRSPDAYERLLMDVVRGNPTLFMRSDEVKASWSWTESILEAWRSTNQPVLPYGAGTVGPADAAVLLGKDGAKWHEEYL